MLLAACAEMFERLVPPAAMEGLPAGRQIGHSRSIARGTATATFLSVR